MKKILILATLLLVSVATNAQGRRGGSNSTLGIKVGTSLFDIKTNNFITTPQYSFVGGFATRGDYYNNWDVQFGMNLFGSKLNIQGRENALVKPTDVEYSLLGVQAQLLFGYKLLGNNRNHRGKFKLTAEFGPVLMVNGKMKLETKSQKDFIITKTDVTAEDLADITGINGNILGGLSLGSKHFRLFVHYQYGINNILNKLNKIDGTTQKFKGHVTMLQFGMLLYL